MTDSRRGWHPQRRVTPRRPFHVKAALAGSAIGLAAGVLLALMGEPAHPQTYRTYPGVGGSSTTRGSDGSEARTYQGIGGSTTTYITGPDGERTTCRTHPGIGGSTRTTCN